MSGKTMYMTEQGLSRLNLEFERLSNQLRPELVEYLHDALPGGDTLDNSELIMLRDQLSFVDGRINELAFILKNAQLIERGEPDGKVHLGNTVVIQDDGSSPESFTIVGTAEADPSEGTISNECPLGRALLDHAVGDEVIVCAPDGERFYRIIAVN